MPASFLVFTIDSHLVQKTGALSLEDKRDNCSIYLLPWRDRGKKCPSYRTLSQIILFFEKTSSSSCQFLSLLSCEGAFSDTVNSLVQENFSGDFTLALYNFESNILSIFLLEENLKTKTYHCVGTYMYIVDVYSAAALTP